MAPLGPSDARRPSALGTDKGKGKHPARPPRSSGVPVARPAAGSHSNGSRGTLHVSERRLADERALWISERQEHLANVLDRHDDLVRPLFFSYFVLLC